MPVPWRKNEIEPVDVAIVAGAAYFAWKWWTYGPPAFASPGGGTVPQTGGAYPVALTPADLERRYNFRELLPNGQRGQVGSQILKNAAPMVIAGRNALGYGIEPADVDASIAVNRYRIASAAGALPIA